MYNKTKNDIKTILEKLDSEDTNFIKFFMSPAGYTIIKTYCDKNKINLNNLKFDDNVEEFLNKLGFYDGKYEISKDTVLPIKTITTQYCDDEIEETTNKFGELLKEYMGKGKDNIIRNIIKILGELLNNISHHSGEKDLLNDDGKVFISQNYQSGQYYSKKNFLQIAIVDSGIGILSSVRKVIPEIQTAEEAIKKALEPKFSGGTTLENKGKDGVGIYNAGVGLTTSFEIIKKLSGDIFIGTKDCLFSYNGETRKECFELIQTWKGTFVVFNIYTDRDIEVDFDDIKTKYMSFGNKSLKNQDFDNNIDFG